MHGDRVVGGEDNPNGGVAGLLYMHELQLNGTLIWSFLASQLYRIPLLQERHI